MGLDEHIDEPWTMRPSLTKGWMDLYYYDENIGSIAIEHAVAVLVALRSFR